MLYRAFSSVKLFLFGPVTRLKKYQLQIIFLKYQLQIIFLKMLITNHFFRNVNYKLFFKILITNFFFNPVTGAHTNMLTLENTLQSVN
jgi:hypothetical protein